MIKVIICWLRLGQRIKCGNPKTLLLKGPEHKKNPTNTIKIRFRGAAISHKHLLYLERHTVACEQAHPSHVSGEEQTDPARRSLVKRHRGSSSRLNFESCARAAKSEAIRREGIGFSSRGFAGQFHARG